MLSSLMDFIEVDFPFEAYQETRWNYSFCLFFTVFIYTDYKYSQHTTKNHCCHQGLATTSVCLHFLQQSCSLPGCSRAEVHLLSLCPVVRSWPFFNQSVSQHIALYNHPGGQMSYNNIKIINKDRY